MGDRSPPCLTTGKGIAMDDVRFDALSRSLGRLGDRRSALKALAALAMSGLVTRITVQPAAARPCQTVADCPEPPCQSVTCKRGKCVFVQAPGCCTEDAQCDDDDPCTSDTCDLSLNRCQHTPTPEGAACGAHKSCRNGRCRCARLQEPCRSAEGLDNDCCQVGDSNGLVLGNYSFCRESPLGDQRCCRGNGGICDLASDCCSSEGVTPGCRNRECCFLPGSVCQASKECCNNGVCRDGTCCAPQPKSTTCDGKCGTVLNNCGSLIDCGCCPLRRVCARASDCCQQHGPTQCKVIHGSSQKGCCRASGEVCGRDTECCGEGVCRGSAGNGRCCQPPQQTCGRDGDCCGAAICRDGTCCENRSGASCNGDADCCGIRSCFSGRCS
jgi:hypothetical protein